MALSENGIAKYRYEWSEHSRDMYGRTMPLSTTRHYIIESDRKLSKEELESIGNCGDDLALDDCKHCYVGDENKDAYIHYVGTGNLVDCGNCGHTFAHRKPTPCELICPKCGFSSDPCDFPDTNAWQEREVK